MRAMQLTEFAPVEEKPLRLVELPRPIPGPGQVRLQVRICGACHTDLHTVEGEIRPPKMPIIPGHQVVGVADMLGVGIETLKIGDRVGVPWFYDACGKCDFCRTGFENLCPQARFTGFHVDGGYAENMLAEAATVLPIPESISNEQAAPLLCAGIIGYRSLIKADLQPGERLGLFGFGASAHLAIQVARHWDCEVFVFTRSLEHRELALQLGAGWVGGVEDTPPKFLDRAVIFAPVGWMVPSALEKLRPGGTLAINAIHMSPIPEMSYELMYGERTLRSVANATYQDGVDFLHLAAEIPVHSTIRMYELEDANQALLDVKHSQINGEAILRIART
jgi:propanol-preferring alcohol dehydrogenase